MSRYALAWWLTVSIPGLVGVACISSTPALPPSDDAGGFTNDGGLPAPDAAPAVDAAPGVDAAPDATPVIDAAPAVDSSPDTGATDASNPDTGATDASNPDTGAADAGNPDTGAADASTTPPCATNNGGCDPNATCANGDAGAICTCIAGFTGSGTSCASDDYTQWPAPSDGPAETEYTVSADGTVVSDGVTGLVWQRQLFANPCPADVDGGSGACTWPDAQSYCASLDGLALGGISAGWRLPTLVELISLVNYGDGSPALDTAIFPATPTVSFWTNTLNASDSTQAWSLSFATGLNATQATTTASPVRCVTSVPSPASTPTCGVGGASCCYANSCGPDLACNASVCAVDVNYAQTVVPDDAPLESSSTVSADGSIVSDATTHLVWQRQVAPNPCSGDGAGVCTWGDAAAYCASLDAGALGGVASGWRLPSIVELLSIVNYSAGAPSLDTALFPGTPPALFWTQTPNAINAAQGWVVDFSTGLNATQATSSASAVRCVSAVAPSLTPACGQSGEPCCSSSACGPDLICNAASTCVVDGTYAQSTLPSDSPAEGAYSVSPGGSTVTDSVTKLVWQRSLLAGPCAGSACSWGGAATYCDSLNALTLGGYGAGWRLPSIVELISIANFSASPTIDPAPFSNPPAASFWSATANAGVAGQAWTMSYATGLNSSQPTATTLGVRCVNASGATPLPEGCGTQGASCCYANGCAATLLCSSGTCVTNADYSLGPVPSDSPSPSEYTISSDTLTALDSVTGLTWSRAAASASTWQGASTFCASLDASSLGGFSTGWRQPSLVEVLSLVNYAAASGPKVDPTAFPNVTATPYWSSTAAAGAAGSAWSVSFSNGLDALLGTGTTNGVLCVNGG